jgi:ATP-dependent RNA helicase DeaD
VALLKRRQPLGKEQEAGGPAQAGTELSDGPSPKAWIRLFVGVGEKDGVGPGDLLGAIAGEAGVEGSQVGKIEIRDTFSLVEVLPPVAEKIIRSLNGTTIRGRAVRVDHDRGGPRGRGGSGQKPRRRLKGDAPPGS